MAVSVGRKSKRLGPTVQFLFGAQRIQTGHGVTCTIAATDATVKWSFDVLAPRNEVPATMTIRVDGVDFMVINFSSDYLTYKGIFEYGSMVEVVEYQKGIVNLQTS